MSFGSIGGAISGDLSGISNLATSLASRLGGTAQTYFGQLRRASYRGVQFVSLGSENSFGRRNAIHEYPKRDVPWVEDMGRAARRFSITGYLVGDDVIAQRETLISACESAGDGQLDHASLGLLTVSLLDFRSIEVWDKGRYVELQFLFVESGPRMFPVATAQTGSLVASAIAALQLSTAAAFSEKVLASLADGASVVGEAVDTALNWARQAESAIGDARNLFKITTNLAGNFGRFIGPASVSEFASSSAPNTDPSATADSLLDAATADRAAVAAAAAGLGSASEALDANSVAQFSAAAQSLVAAVLAATSAPADSIRLLGRLASFSPTQVAQESGVGGSMATMQSGCADLFRRVSVAAIAQASASYEPTSSNDAVRVRDLVTTFIDSEIQVAGDQGEDGMYDALRTVRASVVKDLNARGAALPSMKTFSMNASLPALTLANQLYRDAGRADELVEQADPVHPAFMPLRFNALAS